ncbi:glucose-1-phosphate adenylyltransferase [candidate division LCP-89 bacterium B3_LCP]|uniref:Glucose-1-phosphate adenylyltransferase n=1 Tax=candidate division LCP-89 bacterium B3_LCP TaxID=2012998 RepID=A0A532UYR9_UNCL8|nr:MAG: glucose-1-phosphate adenylyltransferase [candidate division LCP-89 bacterium B3_LCP]
MSSVLCIILGGGQGQRLYPLTKFRSKPAVPIAGKYRLIDIPVSNCINSHIERIFVLTQFNSASLNRHVNLSYKFDAFHEGFVNVLAAEQTTDSMDWFQGTADAVRKTWRHFQRFHADDYLILAGDHIYQMDYRSMLETHRKSNADVTVAVSPITTQEAKGFGILSVGTKGLVTNFLEKPQDSSILTKFQINDKIRDKYKFFDEEKCLLGSMGVYLFKVGALKSSLKNLEHQDFGKHIIPSAIESGKVQIHVFDGYWKDVGTIGSFFNANMDFISPDPKFHFFTETNFIYTHARFLPPSKLLSVDAQSAQISEGCIVEKVKIRSAILGVRTIIKKGTSIENSYVMGADYYEFDPESSSVKNRGDLPPVGIGEDTDISGAIVDKNARIGRGVKITPKKPHENYAGHGYMVKDGITVIEKDAVIPDGAVI